MSRPILRQDSLVPPTRWYASLGRARLHRATLRGSASFWLQAEGSLTRHLQLRCQYRFHVDVVNEGFGRPTLEESRTLAIPLRQRAWIREVRLCGDGTPWVLARTVIPLATLAGRGRRLRQLGRMPLGAWLFSQRQWQRGPLQAGLCPSASPDTPPCARRSVFSAHDRHLLVSEYFLPALLKQPL